MSALLSPSWLIDTAAAVTLLIALVLLIRGPVGRYFGAQCAYALWALPLLRAVLPSITLSVDAPAPAAIGQQVLVLTGPPVGMATSLDLVPWLIAAWLAGAVLFAASALTSTTRLRARVLADSEEVTRFGRVAILRSAAVDGPVAMGIFRPLIALPLDFATRFTPAQQQAVIAHELEHHRGHDLTITLAAFALFALNWFNPIAWAGWRAFRQDQEAACDARTLARTGTDRATYGRAIAAAVAGPALRPAPMLALAMGEKSALIHRLRSLTMTDISTRRRWVGRMSLFMAALVALPMTASISYAVETQDAPPATAQPPAQPRVVVIGGPGTDTPLTERRIERDGRTIIVRSNRPIEDADIDRIVTDAPDGTLPSGSPADGVRRTIIVRRTESSASNSDGQPATMTQRTVQTTIDPEGNDAIVAATAACQSGQPLINIDRRNPANSGQVRILNCVSGDLSPAQRLAALRMARDSLRNATPQMIADLGEARTLALAELDELIAEEERSPGN